MKFIIRIIFRFLVWVAYLTYKIEGVNALLLFMPARIIPTVLRHYGATIGHDPIIHSPLIIHNAKNDYGNLIMGDHCYLGRDVFLDLENRIELEDQVTVSMRVTILTHTDVGDSRLNKRIPASTAPVRICKDAYIGANSTILQGVTIGAESLIGAGSVLLKDVPSGAMFAGNPAKEIKKND